MGNSAYLERAAPAVIVVLQGIPHVQRQARQGGAVVGAVRRRGEPGRDLRARRKGQWARDKRVAGIITTLIPGRPG